MRLSDAMTLGSTLVRFQPGNWSCCAVGAAATAVGVPHGEERVEGIREQWPWLTSNCDERLIELVTLFDRRVCRGEMTLDQLIEHVRQIEPPCECGVCDCVCARVEHLMPPSVEVVAEEVEVAF